MNIELHCTICGKSFLFSEGEIEYYKVRNLQPPKKCKACRQNPYSGLDESIKKLGLSSQDFSKNPASDTGFLPVGFPSTENRSYSLKYPVLQIDDIACYLRIYMVSSNEFTYILVNNEDEATVFPATDNLEWLENSVRKFYSISSIKYQYSCIVNHLKTKEYLQTKQLRMDWHTNYFSIIQYEKSIKQIHKDNCIVDIRPKYDK